MAFDSSSAERLATNIAEDLEKKTFEKHPHIGIIGSRFRSELDPIDLLTEAVEEQTEQWLSPFVSGFRVSIKPLESSNERTIRICYSFYVRISPPTTNGMTVSEKDQFRGVDVCCLIKNELNAQISLVVYDGERGSDVIFSDETHLAMTDGNVRIQFPAEVFRESSNFLTTVTPLGYGTGPCAERRFGYNFSFTTSVEKLPDNSFELEARLIKEEGHYKDNQNRTIPIDDSGQCRNRGIIDDERKSWSVSKLLELQSTLIINGYTFLVTPTKYGMAGLRPINCAYDLGMINEGKLRFRDYSIISERGRAIKTSDRSIIEFVTSLSQNYHAKFGLKEADLASFVQAIGKSLSSIVGGNNLYTFQEKCSENILQCITSNRSPRSALPMAVQTAGGKTLGFLTPICFQVFNLNYFSGSERGVKAMIFYPTRALINDQSDTIIKLIWGINSDLVKKDPKSPYLTFGILHGDTQSKRGIASEMEKQGQQTRQERLRLKCPICDSQLSVSYQRIGQYGLTETVRCEGSVDPLCSLAKNENHIGLFNRTVRVTRESVYSNPPDILVCTPDMINYRLFNDPAHQSIFGKAIKRCNRCGYSTANLREKSACPYCADPLQGPFTPTHPSIFVFDEAHQLRGSFGSQVSHLMSRLEHAVRTLSSEETFNPTYVFSSATLGNPQRFVRDFLGPEVHIEPVVKADYLDDADIVKRVHLFLVPKGYSPEATLIQTIKSAFRNFPLRDRYPNVLIFVNSLAESNELISLLRHFASSLHETREHLELPRIDGHSTDFRSLQREQVEDSFSRGEINLLVATSTLEVGVDFDRIDVLIIYGAPYFLSDYVQRIGRAGRRHAALIVSILPSKPVDFFFFSNYPIVTDFKIREEALNAEAVRLSRENEIIRKKSAVRSFLDYLCTFEGSHKYFKRRDDKSGEELLKALFGPEAVKQGAHNLTQELSIDKIDKRLFEYIESSLRSKISKEEKIVVRSAIRKMLDSMEARGISNLADLYSNKQMRFLDGLSASGLRQSDYVVKIEHPELLQGHLTQKDVTRERSLSIALGDYCPGQITSFRSAYFVVDNIETHQGNSSRIRNAIYRNEYTILEDQE